MKLSRSENTPPDPASQRMSWVPSVNPETSSPKTGTCRTCARENSWPYCPPEPMVFHVFQLQFTAYGGRSPGGRGPMERHSQPPELGRPHPGRIHSGITPPSRPSLECPSSDKTKEGHFLSTVLNGNKAEFSSPPSHAELLSEDAACYCRTDSGGPVRPQVTMIRT